MSQIALTRMIVLPRRLYFFANLPAWLSPYWFGELQQLTRDLVWDTGRWREALHTLQMPLTGGGQFGVPNYKLYYWAAQVQWLARWVKDIDAGEMGEMGDENRRGALIWRMICSPNSVKGDTRLFTVAIKC